MDWANFAWLSPAAFVHELSGIKKFKFQTSSNESKHLEMGDIPSSHAYRQMLWIFCWTQDCNGKRSSLAAGWDPMLRPPKPWNCWGRRTSGFGKTAKTNQKYIALYFNILYLLPRIMTQKIWKYLSMERQSEILVLLCAIGVLKHSIQSAKICPNSFKGSNIYTSKSWSTVHIKRRPTNRPFGFKMRRNWKLQPTT